MFTGGLAGRINAVGMARALTFALRTFELTVRDVCIRPTSASRVAAASAGHYESSQSVCSPNGAN